MSYCTCPICGNPNMNHQSYSDGCFGIEEEYINCTTCNYYYEFCYGNYLESFGRYEFTWGGVIHYITTITSPVNWKRKYEEPNLCPTETGEGDLGKIIVGINQM